VFEVLLVKYKIEIPEEGAGGRKKERKGVLY